MRGERAGSIFEDSHIPLTKCLALIHYWSHNLSIKATVGLLQMTEWNVIRWHKVKISLRTQMQKQLGYPNCAYRIRSKTIS